MQAPSQACYARKNAECQHAPGATERIEAQFSFIGLKKHRLYAGKLQFENAKIILDVECTESPDVSQRRKK